MKIKLHIQPGADREKLVTALASNGFPVWVEVDSAMFKKDDKYYVVFTAPKGAAT